MDRIKMGNFLADLRKRMDLSQADLAEIIGVTFQAVSKWERGEAIPDITILEKLSSFYKVSIDEIIKGEENGKTVSVQAVVPTVEQTEVTPKNNSFLKMKRTFGFWFGLSYFVLLILFGFCPFLKADSIYGSAIHAYVTANYYEIVFSGDFLIGNFIFLFQFLTSICTVAFTMLFYTCTTKKGCCALYNARVVFIIINLATLVLNIVFMFDCSVGNYLIFLTLLTFDILFLCLKQNRKAHILMDFE